MKKVLGVIILGSILTLFVMAFSDVDTKDTIVTIIMSACLIIMMAASVYAGLQLWFEDSSFKFKFPKIKIG